MSAADRRNEWTPRQRFVAAAIWMGFLSAVLSTLLLLSQEEDREPLQYLNAFVRMYGAEAVEAASAALSGEEPFYGLQAVDSDLKAFPAHQSLLKAYEKLQKAKAAYWSK